MEASLSVVAVLPLYYLVITGCAFFIGFLAMPAPLYFLVNFYFPVQ